MEMPAEATGVGNPGKAPCGQAGGRGGGLWGGGSGPAGKEQTPPSDLSSWSIS